MEGVQRPMSAQTGRGSEGGYPWQARPGLRDGKQCCMRSESPLHAPGDPSLLLGKEADGHWAGLGRCHKLAEGRNCFGEGPSHPGQKVEAGGLRTKRSPLSLGSAPLPFYPNPSETPVRREHGMALPEEGP